MNKKLALVTFFATAITFAIFGVSAAAQTNATTTTPAAGTAMMAAPGHGNGGACKEIRAICEQAGFKKGDWKNGDGLKRDCIDPIVQGAKTVPGGTKPLPTVAPDLIAKCKANHPKFGEGKVGSH